MATGKIVQFSSHRGYGFIAPDGGGEEVFVHVNDLDGYSDAIRTGTAVEFGVMTGQRGLRAYDVRIVGPAATSQPPQAPPQQTSHIGPDEDSDTCEVVGTAEYLREITDVLVGASPNMTSAEIVTVRNRLLGFARRRGWLED